MVSVLLSGVCTWVGLLLIIVSGACAVGSFFVAVAPGWFVVLGGDGLDELLVV